MDGARTILRAKVTRVDATGVYVALPAFGLGLEYGPLEVNTSAVVVPGNRVLVGQIGDIQEDYVVLAKIGNVASTAHTHIIADVAGLQLALDAKAALVHTHTKADITDFAHTHNAADVNAGTLAIARLPVAADGVSDATKVVRSDDSRLGGTGGPPTGAAGGSLTGTYPNPTLAAGAVGSAEVNAAIKDAAAGTASLRTLGTGATQAAAGDDVRLSDARTPTAHNHAASDVNSGVFAIARIPTGTTGTTVALGNHTHAIADLPVAASGVSDVTKLVRSDDSRLADARTPVAHVHAAADVTSGVFDIARIPTGTTGVTVALGDHVHSYASLTDNMPLKTRVRALINTANPTLTGTYTWDSVALVANDRVLVVNATTASNNGIWVVQAGAWTRPTDYNSSALATGVIVSVLQGSGDGGSTWWSNYNGTSANFSSAAKNFYRLANDAAAATPSFRTLGTGSTQAAAGDHGHVLTAAGITGTLPVSKGGTNATTVAAARTSLVAAGFNTSTNPAMTAGVWSSSIAHNLNSSHPDVSFNLVTGGESIDMHWKVIDANNIQIRSDVSISAGVVRVLVTAGA